MIGLDATFIRAGRLTGIERHIRELVVQCSSTAPAGRFVLFCRKEVADLFASIRDRTTIRTCPWKLRPMVEQVWLPAAVKRSGVELVHYMTLAPPLVGKKPFLLTIHDLTFWKLPSAVSAGGRLYYRPLLNHALRSKLLRGVITVSAAAREEIRSFLADSIPVWKVPNAPAPHFRPVEDDERDRVLNRYRIARPYILTVGTIEPRKNLTGLFQAFAALLPRSNSKVSLVVVGRRGWERRLFLPPAIADRVHLLGAVPDQDLPALYSAAALFASSSLYEGFGLPVIEALACGTPGVVSDLPSLREVGGDACLYADPTDAPAFADALERGLALATSPEARVRAQKQAARFSWQASAQELLRIYEELLSTGD